MPQLIDKDSRHGVWQFVSNALTKGVPVALLWVVESHGSSPGRRGFHMAATVDACTGTIGGGIMEHKLVELSRAMLSQGETEFILKTQFHDKEHPIDQSGMICSGMQRVVIVPLNAQHLTLVRALQSGGTLEITPLTISAISHAAESVFVYKDDTEWHYRELIGSVPALYIIGGGHVSLALSELMSRLGFAVYVYDDRPQLNTFETNLFAVEKTITTYETIGAVLPADGQDYVVIMTIGYRNDKIVLKQIIDRNFRYLGMLGSVEKVRILFDELREEGIPQSLLDRVHAPIGLPIASRTAYEIAVSIAAEIIREKNK